MANYTVSFDFKDKRSAAAMIEIAAILNDDVNTGDLDVQSICALHLLIDSLSEQVQHSTEQDSLRELHARFHELCERLYDD